MDEGSDLPESAVLHSNILALDVEDSFPSQNVHVKAAVLWLGSSRAKETEVPTRPRERVSPLTHFSVLARSGLSFHAT
jgi:hypothetical protein